MLAVTEAENLINSAAYDFVDGVFVGNIPAEIRNLDNRTDVLITSVNDDPTGFGNNDFFEVENTVEIQVFYNAELNIDLGLTDMQFVRLFRENHWNLQQNKPPITDPTTLQTTKTFYFSKIKEL